MSATKRVCIIITRRSHIFPAHSLSRGEAASISADQNAQRDGPNTCQECTFAFSRARVTVRPS